VRELVVAQDLCIGCGLCVPQCPHHALDMQWNEFGFLVPGLIGTCENDTSCLTVCPFNPFPEKEVRTEDGLSAMYLKDSTSFHRKIGKYINIYAGYADELRLTSSSGGITTYILRELLEQGAVNHIFSVKESHHAGMHYEYALSSTQEDLLTASRTKYYPVTLSSVFSGIDALEGKIAVVGVPCFIKAIRLAQQRNPQWKEKIPFLVGIICGGWKSGFFTEYLSEKSGVQKNACQKPEYRIKDVSSTAADYLFGCYNKNDGREKTIRMRSVGDMWGSGLFKAHACDFCDDVAAELADISIGDAWLEPFVRDGRGANVVITRSLLAEKIIQDGMKNGRLHAESLKPENFIHSQHGGYEHRQTGLSYRMRRAEKSRMTIPPKRWDTNDSITVDYKIVQWIRMAVRKKSLEVWREYSNAALFDKKMNPLRLLLKLASAFNHYKKTFMKNIGNLKLRYSMREE
jgi:coenzyme F420-reducing hydrogenase beta subunit